MGINRREFLGKAVLGVSTLYLVPEMAWASDVCSIMHPLMPPDKSFAGSCHNCGMGRPMWARTFHDYEVGGEVMHVCSLHCLAETTINSGIEPEQVKVAVYGDPTKMIPVASAFYVVGSSAMGTMTMTSKIAFADEAEAQAFAKQCGGQVVRFEEALSMAKASFAKENVKIAENRVKKGKIVEPVDNTDICPVCDMYPARYPSNKCQLQTSDGKVVHFCSTHCLFEYLKDPAKYAQDGAKITLVWVVDYETKSWVYARNSYYVVGSPEAGPMGKEAIPFFSKASAEKFAAGGGSVLHFKEVTIDKIKG